MHANTNIIFGTAQLIKGYGLNHSNISKYELEKIFETLKTHNCNHIDTALNYSGVLKKIGKFNLSKFKIINKFPKIKSRTEKDMKNEMEIFFDFSFKNLNINQIDTILLHDIEDIKNNDRIKMFLDILNYFKQKRYVNKFGVSIYDPLILKNINYADQVDIIQAPYNLINREIEEKKYTYFIKKNKIEIHARSIFLQGLLLAEKDLLYSKFKKWMPIWNKWDRFKNKNYKDDPAKICFNFVKSKKFIDKIIIGVNSNKQLQEIMQYNESNTNYKYPNLLSGDHNLIYPYNWSGTEIK